MPYASRVLFLVLIGANALLALAACESKPEIEDPPSLQGSSTEPVLLRYTFVVGDSYDWSLGGEIEMEMSSQGQSVDGEIDMEVTGTNRVVEVDAEGAGTVELTVGQLRFAMDMAGIELAYDSEDPAGAPPELSALGDMVGQPFRLRVSPLGEVLDEDLGSVFQSFGTSAMPGGAGLHDNVATSSFIRLSPDPVGPGDRFGSGTLSIPSGQATFEVAAEYEVLEIGGDGNEVLVEPHVDVAGALEGMPGMSVDSSELDAWFLFDVGLGIATQSALGMQLDFSMSQGPTQGEGSMAVAMTYSTSNFQRGDGTLPEPTPSPPTGATSPPPRSNTAPVAPALPGAYDEGAQAPE